MKGLELGLLMVRVRVRARVRVIGQGLGSGLGLGLGVRIRVMDRLGHGLGSEGLDNAFLYERLYYSLWQRRICFGEHGVPYEARRVTNRRRW